MRMAIKIALVVKLEKVEQKDEHVVDP